MELFVNGQKIDITLEGEKTVGEVLRSFEKTAMENKCATVEISVDGKKIGSENFDAVSESELKADTKIELSMITEAAVTEAFLESASDIEKTVEALSQIPAFLQGGQDGKARKAIASLADVVDNFCHVTALSALFPEKFAFLKIKTEEKSLSLSEFFSDFMPIFNDLNGALESGDSVLLGDLAEYEICPRLKSLAAAVKEL